MYKCLIIKMIYILMIALGHLLIIDIYNDDNYDIYQFYHLINGITSAGIRVSFFSSVSFFEDFQ